MCVCVCIVHVGAVTHCGHKGALDLLELELTGIVILLMQVPAPELWFFDGVVNTLDC